MATNCFRCNRIKDVDPEGLCDECQAEKKLIDKINKLLALTGSPNKAEAELAAQRAHELLTKYNLDIADLQEKEIYEGEARSGRSIKKWRRLLINSVAKYYYCRSLFYDGGSGYYKIVFVGHKHNIIICKSMFDYLEKSVLRETKNLHKNAKYKYRENFKLGMATEISFRLYQLLNAKTTSEEKALIVTENKLIEKYFKEKGTRQGEIEINPKNKTAFHRGIIAGSKVSLNDQIKNTSVPMELL
jgi:hypothetical protein